MNNMQENDSCYENLVVLKEMYQCNKCLQIFCEIDELNEHNCLCDHDHSEEFLSESDIELEICSLGDKIIPNKRPSSKKNTYICGICYKKFTQKRLFENHCKLHSKQLCRSSSIVTKFVYKKDNLTEKIHPENVLEINNEFAGPDEEHLNNDLIHRKEADARKREIEIENARLKAEYQKYLALKRKKYVCEVCHEAFSRKIVYKRHKRLHITPMECELCLEKFKKKTDFSEHMKIHRRNKDFKCDKCDRRFCLKVYLTQHQRSHLDKEIIVYKCDVCDKQFKYLHNYKRHYRFHTNEKPYSCNICKRTFSRKDNLNTHYTVHGDISHAIDHRVRSFMCEKCGKIFYNRAVLKIHQYRHEGNAHKHFACDKCDMQFFYKSQLTVHYRKHTNERPYKCNTCQKAFRSKLTLIGHQQTHAEVLPFHCTVCDRYYATKGSYKIHIRIHSDNPIICEVCGRHFTYLYCLNEHMVTHTKEKPFKCDLCHKQFTQKGTLKRHVCNCPYKPISKDDVFVTKLDYS